MPVVASEDSLMRSLPEVSKETGIPMPLILRLANQHPDKIPSSGSGSQRFFPVGVVPVLLALYRRLDAPRDERRTPLLTIARRRQEQREAVERTSAPDKSAQDQDTPAESALALRLDGLEDKQVRIMEALEEIPESLRGPWFGTAIPSF